MKLRMNGEKLHQIYVIVVFLVLARFFRFPYFELHFPLVQTLYARASQACAILVAGLFLLRYRNRMNKFHLGMLAVYGCLLLSTLIAGGNLRRLISSAYPPVALVMFITMECASLKKTKRFARTLTDMFLLLVGINTVLLVFFPDLFGRTGGTHGRVFLLGLENQLGYVLVTGLIIVLANDFLNHEKWKLQLYALLYAVTTVANFSVGSIMGAMVLLVYLFPPVQRLVQKKSFMVFAGAVLVGGLILVLWGETILSFPPFRFIIEDILGKDITLTHRTTIWKVAMEGFAKNPILGYGYGDSVNLFTIVVRGKYATYSAHNQFVQMLYEGGAVAMVALIATLYLTGKTYASSVNQKFAAGCKAITLCVMVMYLTEAPGLDILFFVLAFGSAVILVQNTHQRRLTQKLEKKTSSGGDLVTVVIPVRRDEQYLGACIDSVIGQTYSNLQIILVHDRTNDGTRKICRQYAIDDPRVVLIHQEDQGLSAARNAGIKAAAGRYITFVDSGDVADRSMVEHLCRLMNNTGADMAVCQIKPVDEMGKETASAREHLNKVFRGKNACMRGFFREEELSTAVQGKLYKTELFAGIAYPEEKCHEDVFTTYQLVDRCQVIVCGREQLYVRRQYGDCTTSVDPDMVEGIEQQAAFVEKHYPMLKWDAFGKIIGACNSCVKRLSNDPAEDEKTIAYLRQRYRDHEGAFLLGSGGMGEKLFSVCAWVNLKAMLELMNKVSNLKGKIIK